MIRACAIQLLGGFAVETDGHPVPAAAWQHRRGADLVKLLSLASGHRLHREQIVDHLWPELGLDAGNANLRKAVHYARRALGAREALVIDAGMVLLWPDGDLRVDTEAFEAAAREAMARGSGHEAVALMCPGDLLPEDRYADWTEPHRERIRAQRIALLREARQWERILQIDRADEPAHRALMQVHLRAGNRQAAIRQFQRLREVLRLDLGLGPDPDTVALFERALATEGPMPSTAAERAQALLARALVAWNRREFETAERTAEQVRRLALDNHLGRELGEASALLGMVAWACGRWYECFRAEFVQALTFSPEQGAFIFDAHVCLAEAALASADSASVGNLARELLPAAQNAGSVAGEALMSQLAGESALVVGHFDDATAWLTRARELYESIDAESGLAFVLLRLAQVALGLDRRTEAQRLVAAARPLAEDSVLAPHLLVRLFGTAIDTAESDAAKLIAFESAERTLGTEQPCGPCAMGFRISAAIACARCDELAKSRRCLDDAARVAGLWQSGPWQAAVWEARAQLRAAEGAPAQAVALLQEATDMFADSGRPIDAARCRAAGQRLRAATTAP